MASFVLSFYRLDVLDGIWDVIESVSEGFLTYSFTSAKFQKLLSKLYHTENSKAEGHIV